MTTRVKLFATVMILGVSFVGAFAQEKKVTRKQLPAAVEQTVDKESEGATIKGFATEIEHGLVPSAKEWTGGAVTTDAAALVEELLVDNRSDGHTLLEPLRR